MNKWWMSLTETQRPHRNALPQGTEPSLIWRSAERIRRLVFVQAGLLLLKRLLPHAGVQGCMQIGHIRSIGEQGKAQIFIREFMPFSGSILT